MKKPAPKGTFKGFMKSEPHEVRIGGKKLQHLDFEN